MEGTSLAKDVIMIDSQKRPKIITVLCVLTMVGCCLSVIWDIYQYYSITQSEVSLENMVKSKGDTYGLMTGIQEVIRKAIDHALLNLIIGILCSAICFYGVVQMWKLKKIGFFIYSFGEIAPAIAAFFLTGGGLLSGFLLVSRLLFCIVWIVLYAINYKYLHN